jgi:hypothetical protein
MWDGVFSPPVTKGSVTDHFKIVSEEKDPTTEMVTVGVEFENSPGKVYIFEFSVEEWDGKKETIANELQA